VVQPPPEDLPVEQATTVAVDEAAATTPSSHLSGVATAEDNGNSDASDTDTQRAAFSQDHQREAAPIVRGPVPVADSCLGTLIEAETAIEGTVEQDPDKSHRSSDRMRRKETKQAKKLRAAATHSALVAEAAEKSEEERKAKLVAERAKIVENLRGAKGGKTGAAGGKGGSKTGARGKVERR
jgi:hypothetical protein